MRPRARHLVLVTGMSGTGKSVVLAELARRGHRTVDTDDPGWIVRDDDEPQWDLPAVRALLDEHDHGVLFVGGCVANQGELYERFDAVVLLSAPIGVLLARVVDRTNPYGSTAADRAAIAADHATVEPVLRAGATHEIVTTGALTAVAAELEKIAVTPAT